MQQRACVSFTLGVFVVIPNPAAESLFDVDSPWRDEGIQTLKRNLSLPVILSAV
jgi:hypothetical protein